MIITRVALGVNNKIPKDKTVSSFRQKPNDRMSLVDFYHSQPPLEKGSELIISWFLSDKLSISQLKLFFNSVPIMPRLSEAKDKKKTLQLLTNRVK